MGKTSVFDLDPERLNRLLAIGKENVDVPYTEPPEAVPEAEGPAEELGSWVGRYRLLGILGEGGMGIVYLAQQEHPIQRQVALKVIKPGMDTRRVIARFEAERQTLAMLDHPNIAHVHDAGTTKSGRPFFVMEYVEGLPITDYCDRNKLSLEERLRLFEQVCQAIHHAHQKGIIHRDIKPSNILVATQEDLAIPKVIDFGVARAIKQPLTERTLSTEQGQLVGTPEYMSPEQLDLEEVGADIRSDVYSLGVLLYVLLAGTLPFESEMVREQGLERLRRTTREQDAKPPSTRLGSLGEKAVAVAQSRRTDVRTLTRDLRKELEWIPLKAMRKEREQRYQSAAELAKDVRNYLDGAPLIASPPSRLYRVRKLVRRHRTLVSAVVLVWLTITIGVVVSTTMYARAQAEAQRSQAISGFLNGTVFRALDPYREQGGSITTLSVLDAVAAGLENRFRDTPRIEAEVRHGLGRTYEANAQYEAAIQNLQRAFDIRRRELGSQDPLTMETTHRLAWALCQAGRLQEAEPLFLWLVTEYTRQFGEENARTISAKRMLTCNYRLLRDYEAAWELSQDVFATARRVLGDQKELTILAGMETASLDVLKGRYSDAEKRLRETLHSSQEGLGRDRVYTHIITGRLGIVYLLQGRYPDAEQALLSSIAGESRIFGPADSSTIQKVAYLIRLYVIWDRLEDAATWRAKLDSLIGGDTGEQPGGIKYDATTDTYAMSGSRSSGICINHVLDEFHFAPKTMRGDGAITARIDNIDDADPWSHAGIMIRNTLQPTSRHAAILVRPCGVVEFWRRATERGLARHTATRCSGLPRWLRLTRQGNTFTAQHSSDGITWELVRSSDPNQLGTPEVAMNETVYVGLFVTSWEAGQTPRAQMSNVTLSGDIGPAGPFTQSEDIGFQSISLLKTGK